MQRTLPLVVLVLLGCEGTAASVLPRADSTADAVCSVSTREPGRVTVRRLNRFEYDATVRDLLGDQSQPSKAFPTDDFGHGFDNQADVLFTAPLLVEKYDAAAQAVLKHALDSEYSPPVLVHVDATAATASVGSAEGNAWNLYSNGTLTAPARAPMAGSYTLRVQAYEEAAGPDRAKMALLVDGQRVTTVSVTAAPALYTAQVMLTAGTHTIGAEFLNDYYQAPEDRNLLVRYLELERPGQGAGADARVLICDPASGADCVQRIVRTFARKAWRRPPSSTEVSRYVGVVEAGVAEGEPVTAALQRSLSAMLLSPNFLYRAEADASQGVRPLDDYELAARLSYFLWGSTPDAELSALADSGGLRANLEPQVRRMLADPRSDALVTQFAGNWLWSRTVPDANPDPVLFPMMTPALKEALRGETEAFFRTFLQEDRSALELLASDDAFVNDALASHYGMPAPGSTSLVRVRRLPEGRGGLFGQSGLLTVTSQPTRTSPVKRGKWTLTQLLCTEPPPPPPGVPTLVPPATPTGSLRAQLEAHRANPSCAGCHATMDPLGFGLENFDAVGRWRTTDTGGFAIDASGQLPDGTRFSGPKELAAALTTDQRFPRCVTQQLFTYALGRETSALDACTLSDLEGTFQQKGYRLPELIVALVQSAPFTQRRAEAP